MDEDPRQKKEMDLHPATWDRQYDTSMIDLFLNS